MVLREAYFPIQTLQMPQHERREKKPKKTKPPPKPRFEWKKHYPSLSKFYLLLFFNIQQYQQAVYLKLSEVLVLE